MKKLIILLLCVLFILPITAYATDAKVITQHDELNLREHPSLDAEVIDAAPIGAIINVLSDNQNGWFQVYYNGKYGYMSAQYLQLIPVVEVNIPQTTGIFNGYVNDNANMRYGPSLTSDIYTTLASGTSIWINGSCGSWYEIMYNGQIGYVYGDYVVLSTTREVVQQTHTVQAITTEEPIYSNSVADVAYSCLGVPYVWAGEDRNGFDCSGLVKYCYAQCGYTVSRVAQDQASDGVDVDLNNLQPGDILCFGSSRDNIWHSGIYYGNGQYIHADGSYVTLGNLSDRTNLICARRIMG